MFLLINSIFGIITNIGINMEKTKASLITHPIRARLILAIMGRELTTQQLATLLPDIPRTSLYRQIRELTEAGVFTVVSETAIRGTVEKTYALSQSAVTLGNKEVREAGHEEYVRLASSYLGGMLDVYNAYLARQEDNFAENILLRVGSVNLTDEEFQYFRKQLVDLLDGLRDTPPAPGRRRRVIGLLGVPDQPEPSPEEPGA